LAIRHELLQGMKGYNDLAPISRIIQLDDDVEENGEHLGGRGYEKNRPFVVAVYVNEEGTCHTKCIKYMLSR